MSFADDSAYKIESLEVIGTNRIDATTISTQLGLLPNTQLTEDVVMDARLRLLGLGLFKSAVLYVRKGSKPGFVNVTIEVVDDPSVIGESGTGGQLGATISHGNLKHSDPNAIPMDFRLGLVSRNFYGSGHRGSIMWDMDHRGIMRNAQLAYGLPRFTSESTQFDTAVTISDPYYRFHETLGYGIRADAIWSISRKDDLEVQYGAAAYLNKQPRLSVLGFPKLTAGPKIGIRSETRLNTFFPGTGHLVEGHVLVALGKTHQSALEGHAAYTWSLLSAAMITGDIKALYSGHHGTAGRAEIAFDLPLTDLKTSGDQSGLFIRLRAGEDRSKVETLRGASGTLGIKYHSAGFIAELGIKVTRAPEPATPSFINDKEPIL